MKPLSVVSFSATSSVYSIIRYETVLNKGHHSVTYPTYRQKCSDALFDCQYVTDSGIKGEGNMITSLSSFHEGRAIFPLILDISGDDKKTSSGLGSKGNNTQMSWNVFNLTTPTASASTGAEASLTATIIVEMSNTLVINSLKSVAVKY